MDAHTHEIEIGLLKYQLDEERKRRELLDETVKVLTHQLHEQRRENSTTNTIMQRTKQELEACKTLLLLRYNDLATAKQQISFLYGQIAQLQQQRSVAATQILENVAKQDFKGGGEAVDNQAMDNKMLKMASQYTCLASTSFAMAKELADARQKISHLEADLSRTPVAPSSLSSTPKRSIDVSAQVSDRPTNRGSTIFAQSGCLPTNQGRGDESESDGSFGESEDINYSALQEKLEQTEEELANLKVALQASNGLKFAMAAAKRDVESELAVAREQAVIALSQCSDMAAEMSCLRHEMGKMSGSRSQEVLGGDKTAPPPNEKFLSTKASISCDLHEM